MSRPKLAVLDDYANVAPKHLDQFADKLDITYFPDTLNPNDPIDLDRLVDRLASFELISTMRERTPFRENLIKRLPNLKVLFTTGPRNGGIDVKACADQNVPVVGTPGKPGVPGFDTTNEQTWALILGLTKGIAELDHRLKSDPNAWQSFMAVPLESKKLGLLGLGRLGLQCAVTGKLGFGMDVIAWSTSLTQEKADEVVVKRGLPKGSVTVVSSKEELFRQADVLSVHLVLGDRSRNAVGREELSWMKESACLINTSRGPIIDEDALLKTLKAGKIRGYAADVFNTEPLPSDSDWRRVKWGQEGRSRVLLSPHMGYVTDTVLNSMYEQTAENIQAWLEGREFGTILKP